MKNTLTIMSEKIINPDSETTIGDALMAEPLIISTIFPPKKHPRDGEQYLKNGYPNIAYHIARIVLHHRYYLSKRI